MRIFYSPLQRNRLATPVLPFVDLARGGAGLAASRLGDTLMEASAAVEAESWLFRNRLNILCVLLACAAALSACIHLMAPGLAKRLAEGLPGGWVRSSSEQVLSEMDAQRLSPTRLSLSEQDALRTRFAGLKAAPEGAPPYRLIFRRFNTPGKSLLTLPGGEVIVSDQFMSAVPDQSERIALLCHELGQLQHRHVLHNAVEHQLYWLASAAFIGSSESSVRALARGIHQASYTRENLLEADQYARSMLRANGLPAQLLIDAIEHGQGPAGTADDQAYFNDRVVALQNLP